ncbi:MAG TPA: acyl-CoA dehydrogenase family protein [Streptosporangiaceae bacterium]|jgi:alkylation response protein AidB-like acyl-CoA dehydrogenase|nr:acyl-CoA dehydrogenase family protein [Streptosporangiaceae bacterium]
MRAALRESRDEAAKALFELTAEIAENELRPAAAAAERDGRFPREEFRLLGRSGLLGLPYPEEFGGAAQPYETYLQVVEELAGAWLTVGLGLSVHVLSCFALINAGSKEQQERWLPDMLGGELLGAYCLSEPGSGSDAAAMRTSAQADGSEFILNGTKAWITHAGPADFYTVFARTSGDPDGRDRARGISCFHVPAQTPGVCPAEPEHKMGMRASVTAQVNFESAAIPADHLVGEQDRGFAIALAALDSGRLGIAACSTGVAQAALDVAVAYARERQQFGRPIIEFQGLSFMLADMATSVAAARSLYLAAARRKDAGLPFGQQAAMAKLFASDTAMKVTTDAVQVLGGYGYVEDFPAERLMREAKVLQIVEGTNQIQRMVIGRSLATDQG